MACRNLIKAKEAKEEMEESTKEESGTGELIVEQLDLCSLRSVREMCARVTSQTERVEALVCNAGVMMCPEARTEDGFETHIGSNHLAHALLALLLLPLMTKSEHARIVFVSSRLFQFYTLNLDDINYERSPYSPLKAYSYSKVANVLFAKALDIKLKEHNITNVTTYSVHPGIVKTDIGRHFPETAWQFITYGFQNVLLQWSWKTPKCGAQTSIYCAIDEKCQMESGYYYSDCSKGWMTRQCRSTKQANKLWDITIKMLNIEDYDPFKQAM
ncbi:retinol dehydrogenase 14-like [Anticarsia gemmatalis]|uniref:retinol dehydrogenase 14-like n=1 Tax=Anticarsia gemmatalis TaxID=129554 RepID=UPI003F7594AA